MGCRKGTENASELNLVTSYLYRGLVYWNRLSGSLCQLFAFG